MRKEMDHVTKQEGNLMEILTSAAVDYLQKILQPFEDKHSKSRVRASVSGHFFSADSRQSYSEEIHHWTTDISISPPTVALIMQQCSGTPELYTSSRRDSWLSSFLFLSCHPVKRWEHSWRQQDHTFSQRPVTGRGSRPTMDTKEIATLHHDFWSFRNGLNILNWWNQNRASICGSIFFLPWRGQTDDQIM